ncbi:MAG TPA: DUF3828 domain-containing protein [Pyrinomonadaceae bacterium]
MTSRLIISSAMVLFATMALSNSKAQTAPRLTPNALVADLYRAHNHKRSPFFQTRSRARLYAYFEKDLADLIWKDAVNSKGEVGVIDGDPLYDAQDMEIKNFAIAKARNEAGRTMVDVTFENFGQKKSITFILVKLAQGWRIHDIDYGPGRTMRSWFK